MSVFSDTIIHEKYAHAVGGRKETWPEVAKRVAGEVMKVVPAPGWMCHEVQQAITKREFLPGGRYLYATGYPYHQTQNCLLLRAEDSREGWADVLQKSGLALMTGAGIGVVYSGVRGEGAPIRKTGGKSTGPIALMQMVNETGRFVRQGGSRRSAIWAGLRWDHPDVMKFIHVKDWPPEVRALKAKDYSFPAVLDGTNVSVILDDAFFQAYHDEEHDKHTLAKVVYWEAVRQMLKKGEPGFSVDVGENAGENLRNAPVVGRTQVLTTNGHTRVDAIVGKEVIVWTGHRWAKTTFKKTGWGVPVVEVKMTGGRSITCDPTHEFITSKEERIRAEHLYSGLDLKVRLPKGNLTGEHDKEAYTLGFVFGDGSFIKGYDRAEVTLCTPEKEECLDGFDQSLIKDTKRDSRGYVRIYFHEDEIFSEHSKETVPEFVKAWSLEKQASFVAGLFDSDGSYAEGMVRLASKHLSFLQDVRRMLEGLGILSGISTAGLSGYSNSQGYLLVVMASHTTKFSQTIQTIRLPVTSYAAYREAKIKVIAVEPAGNEDVYCCDVGVDEHSFQAEGVIISNCCEITSRDDSDICNLGSINMAKVRDLGHMQELVDLGTAFLLAGTVYSDVPYPKVDQVRSRNRRLGLGLMGIHEWLMKRGKKYGPDDELAEYLEVYARATDVAREHAMKWDLSPPLKTRAIAPNGTIGIVAETTTGIEPLFFAACKRRYLKGNVFHYQYVVDPTAKRLHQEGIKDIEDAYTLAEDVERRVAFQAWVQQWVDHAISSTINLPAWGTENNCQDKVQSFGEMLLQYLPKLRGITCYPDGARDGQPLNACPLEEAITHEGEVHEEQGDVCSLRAGESCGA